MIWVIRPARRDRPARDSPRVVRSCWPNPQAGDDLAAVANPVSRIYSAYSTLMCVPNAVAQSGAAPLGAQADERAISAVLREAGFQQVRRAAETPVNLVLEARV